MDFPTALNDVDGGKIDKLLLHCCTRNARGYLSDPMLCRLHLAALPGRRSRLG